MIDEDRRLIEVLLGPQYSQSPHILRESSCWVSCKHEDEQVSRTETTALPTMKTVFHSLGLQTVSGIIVRQCNLCLPSDVYVEGCGGRPCMFLGTSSIQLLSGSSMNAT